MKKRFSALLAMLLGLIMALSLILVGCGETPNDDNNGDSGTPPVIKPDDDNPNTPGDDEDEFTVSYRTDYTPTRFSDVTNEVTELTEGVYLVANKLTMKSGLLNGKTSVVYTIEVDLTKANIVAGTKDNATTDFNWEKAVPYRMALDWEEATGGHVYACINADFFGSKTVNAFVKDGIIIKDSHNDTGVPGNYNYTNTSVDVPASAPMLFGVNGTKAQIAPIITVEGDPTTAAVKEQLVKAKLSYGILDGTKMYTVRENTTPTQLQTNEIAFHTSTSDEVSPSKGYVVKVDNTKGITELKVLEVKKITSRTPLTAGEGYAYLYNNASSGNTATYLSKLHEGDTLSLSVASPDGKWNGYQTILGCRQALVIDNEIASTVTLENSNRAQDQEVPRTAVGVKDGKVVLFAVESMYYYGKDSEGDTHGVNLPDLAEFAYYYGCSDAANFDGGGSTHLVVHPENEEARVVVRSADFDATTNPFTTRVVMNSFLITSRVDK